MKLFIVFDVPYNLKSEASSDDYILVNTIALKKNYDADFKNVFYFNIASQYSKCDKEKLQHYCDLLKNEFSKINLELLNILNYAYFKTFLPCYLYVDYIEGLIKTKHIDLIILYGGTELIFFPSLGGEGEGKKKFYKTAWMINPVIYQLLKRRVNIVWKYKSNSCYLKTIHWLRENYFQIRTLLASVYHYIRMKKVIITDIEQKKNSLLYCNLQIQKEHLEYIKDRMQIDNGIFYMKSKCNEEKNILITKPLFVKDLFFVFLKTYRIKFHIKSNLAYVGKLEISKRFFTRCFRTFLLLYYLELEENEKNLSKIQENISSCITNMTFGTDIFAVHTFCKKHAIKHINYQYVAMSVLPLPIYEMADEYYLYSNCVYEYYKKFSGTFKRYLYLEQYPVQLCNKDILMIGIFLQPDCYTEAYIELLASLGNEIFLQKVSVRIVIKKHPRQERLREFQKIIDKYKFYEWAADEMSARNVILQVDIVASICSSVLYEAFSNGKFGLILNLDNMYTEHIKSNDSCCPSVNIMINKLDDILSIIKNFSNWYNKYLQRYWKYVKEIEDNGNK